MYSLENGVRRPLWRRILSGFFTALAIAGWLVLIILIVSVLTNTFDEILIYWWEF